MSHQQHLIETKPPEGSLIHDTIIKIILKNPQARRNIKTISIKKITNKAQKNDIKQIISSFTKKEAVGEREKKE